ncbi:MAG: hypothetical protein ACKOAU_03235 [Pirellula sp.]
MQIIRKCRETCWLGPVRIAAAAVVCGLSLSSLTKLCAQHLPAQQSPPNLVSNPSAYPSAALTSKDYLKLMEQANEAAGIPSGGGNYVGAKPRPLGSIEPQTPQQVQPVQVQPVQSMPEEPQVWFPPAAPQPPVPRVSALDPVSGVQASTLAPRPDKPWSGPRWVGAYSTLGLRRAGDESMTFSQGGELGTFGSDLASQMTLGYMTNPIDCYEFTYLGSLRWARELDSVGPVNSQIASNDPQWQVPFQNADLHQQTHLANLRQYGLNRRWLTDDIGNSTIGLRVIDYNEQYRLRSLRQGRQALYGLDTSNLLVGLGTGMELWRPVSQRIALGGAIDGGLYANFADASITAEDGQSRKSGVDDQDLSLAASFGLHLRARYQLRSWAGLYGGYRWMVISGLATVDDQAPEPLADRMSLSTSSDATILFHGFDAGIEMRF